MSSRAFSIEDQRLGTRRLVGARERPFSDIDLSFDRRFDGDVFKKQGAAAVKQSVRNLLLTSFYEKPFEWQFGTDLYSQLFELDTQTSEWDIEQSIRSAVERYEPRAVIETVEINIDPDRHSVFVRVTFRVVNYEELVSVNVSLSRLR